MSAAADVGRVRAGVMIRMALADENTEAEAFLAAVPDDELRAVVVAAVAHAAVAYRQTVGAHLGLILLNET